MWVKKASLWLDMDHRLLVFNLCVGCVSGDVKTSDVRSACWEAAPGSGQFALFRPINTLCWFPARAFPHPAFAARKLCGWGPSPLTLLTACSPPAKPCLLNTPSAFPAPACLLHLITVQWSHSLSYLSELQVPDDTWSRGFHSRVFLSLWAWSGTHGRCSVRANVWLP